MGTIIDRFFAEYGLQPGDDYFPRLTPANESPNMHIILDMNCKTVPTVDLGTIEYKVFKVKKNDELYVVLLSLRSPLISKLAILSNSTTLHAKKLACAAWTAFTGALTDPIHPRNWTAFVCHKQGNCLAHWYLEHQVTRVDLSYSRFEVNSVQSVPVL